MDDPETSSPAQLEVRKAVFLALVEEQDKGSSVKNSRELIADQFAIPTDVVREIELEGLDQGWPPL
jgi:hypothetical protein